MKLVPAGRYDAGILWDILARYPSHSVFQLHDEAYWRVLRADDALGLCRVHLNQRDAALHSEQIHGDLPEDTVRRSLQHILAIDTRLDDFYAQAQSDAALWSVIEPLVGLPLYRTESIYEALIFTIIEQHISWVAANRAQQWLVHTYGDPVTHEQTTYYAMPTPQVLAQTTVDDLKPTKITFGRMELIIRLSQQIVSGELNLAALAGATSQTMYAALLEIKGIGHWTAANVVHRALGVYPYVLHNDVALQNAVAHYFNVEKSAAAVKEMFSADDDYAGLAAHFTLMRYVLDFYEPVIERE